MKNAYQQQQATRIEKILEHLPKKADQQLIDFTRQFYAKMPVADLQQIDAGKASAIAQSAYAFMQTRRGSAPKIRIFTPRESEHGYEGRYTVIELINDDMPFLVDSLSAELGRLNLTIRETIHPIFNTVRDAKGGLTGIGAEKQQAKNESLIHFEVSALPENLDAAQLEKDLGNILTHIRAAVGDWRTIVGKVEEARENLDSFKSYFDAQSISEIKDFLGWLVNRNFIFLGYAEYDFFDAKGREELSAVADSKLGILKIEDEENPRGLEAMPSELRHLLLVPQLIEITKSNRRSPVHRPVPMDYVGLKRFDKKGKIIGEARFLGLFTSNVYYQSVEMIPFARKKIAQVLERSEFAPSSHDGKSLKSILEFLPRDEIFQMSEEDLLETGMGILALEAKPGVRVFMRKDAFERFVSLMIYVPRESYSTELRQQIQAIVEEAFNGATAGFSTQITEAPLTRLHLIVRTSPGEIPQADVASIEREIAKRAYLWSDLLLDAIFEKYGEQKTEKWHRAYANAFPKNYINRHDASAAAHDINKIEAAIAAGGLELELFQSHSEPADMLHLKIYNPNEEIALSDILPVLENSGFRVIDEHPFLINPQGASQVWIRDFKLQVAALPADFERVKPLVEEAILKVWQREMETDRFNALVLKAGLSWRQVTLVRAYAKYLRQIGFTYSQPAIEQAFGQHPAIAANIVALFEARFNPSTKNREEKCDTLKRDIEEQLAQVSNAAEDVILRRYLQVILATLRSNYYQTGADGAHKPVLSFKLNSHAVPELPKPLPFAEIFVYGMRVEGIHLRGGKVARGGLRWSDRPEDYRTEVLGLMKAQMVKNSVIVPVGSKGGFIVKRPVTGEREAQMEEGIACYKLYLQGLLDITDNIVKHKITPPAQVVRHDEDDPYLVVAADKGTASFSDIANGVSESYGFWLGDAFASGGSVGYDHKAMAITARGGWVSVTRHFAEMGVDIAKQDFTVAGIGDMAGDVFGNGMILSDHIKLLAAFNHMHIFLDPNPDTELSFAERKRLFDLPRSSWKDYNTALISKGGGIFERSAKSIAVSKEAQAALGLSKSSFTPEELIHNLLLAPVDLLWNGGIGTYVKAEEETHDLVGDRANNGLRVNGRELRCKVVGEGGNLGFTQKGRVEYARAGGRINTDAIDNSAGVDCSDHEVNIKIGLSHEMASGDLTLAKRNRFLASMTDEVARLVIKDNILQTQAITIAEQRGEHLLESETRLMHLLEKSGLLDRALEFLPSDKQLSDLAAARKGLTRPELAVLLAYSKMELYRELLNSSLPDEPYFTADLKRYFPKAMQQQFERSITSHPLKREIIATVVTNSLVNRAGITFWSDLTQDLNVSPRDVTVSYTIARDVFGLRAIWQEIEQLGGGLSAVVQADLYASLNDFMEDTARWLLRNLPLPLDIAAISEEMAPGLLELQKTKKSLLSEGSSQETAEAYKNLSMQGVPDSLAEKVAALEWLSRAPDLIAVAHKNKMPVASVGEVYFALGDQLGLDWLNAAAAHVTAASYWDRLALQALKGDLLDEQRRLSDEAITSKGGMDAWLEAHAAEVARLKQGMDELRGSGVMDLPKLILALKHVRALH